MGQYKKDEILAEFLSGTPANKIKYKSLGVSKRQFYEIVDAELPKFEVKNRYDAWKLYEKANTKESFARTARLNITTLKTTLIEIGLSKLEIKKLYEGEGYTYRKLLNIINMPLVTEDDIHAYVSRNGMKHSLQDKEHNRLEGIRAFASDREKIYARNDKVKSTMLERYGHPSTFQVPSIIGKIHQANLLKYGSENVLASPIIKKAISQTVLRKYGVTSIHQKEITFSPTRNVRTVEESIEITKNEESLERFLKTNFPNKSSFTLAEVAKLTGRKYSFIKSRFGTDMSFIKNSNFGELPETMRIFLVELGFKEGTDFIVNDRKVISPMEIDFYFPNEKVGIEVNDIWTHNSSYMPFGKVKSKDYHMKKSDLAKEKGVHLIHAWESYFNNPTQFSILKSSIKRALGVGVNKVQAGNTLVKKVPNSALRDFFTDNSIQGFNDAEDAYVLCDKDTEEVLMACSTSKSSTSVNTVNIVGYTTRINTEVIGGTNKLLKFIIDDNPGIVSITYGIDRNLNTEEPMMPSIGTTKLLSTQVGIWSYNTATGDMSPINTDKQENGLTTHESGYKTLMVYDAGVDSYVWNR